MIRSWDSAAPPVSKRSAQSNAQSVPTVETSEQPTLVAVEDVSTDAKLEILDQLEKIDSPPQDTADEAKELHWLTGELRRRIGSLHRDIAGRTGVPTAGQKAQIEYLTDAMTQVGPRVQALKNQ